MNNSPRDRSSVQKSIFLLVVCDILDVDSSLVAASETDVGLFGGKMGGHFSTGAASEPDDEAPSSGKPAS